MTENETRTDARNGDGYPSGPLSWRDVYKAVGDSEARVIEAIKVAIAPMVDHEARLRNLEVNGSPEAIEALGRIRTLEGAVAPLAITTVERDKRITAMEVQTQVNKEAIDRFVYRESGIFTTIGAGKTMLLVFLASVGPILAIYGLLVK
jgi:hypothetical protein